VDSGKVPPARQQQSKPEPAPMTTPTNATAKRIGGPGTRPAVNAELLDVRTVAAMLDCSPRHVYRLADAGKMPRPIKLGALIRWRAAELADWIGTGCPSVRASRTTKAAS